MYGAVWGCEWRGEHHRFKGAGRRECRGCPPSVLPVPAALLDSLSANQRSSARGGPMLLNTHPARIIPRRSASASPAPPSSQPIAPPSSATAAARPYLQPSPPTERIRIPTLTTNMDSWI